MPDGSGSSRPAPSAGQEHLFLREEELRLAQDLLFFGYRDFTAGADTVLDALGLGRAHHRVLHFVGRRPGLTVGELLAILGITKQSLGRVLTALVDGGYVAQAPGRADRRQRLLWLTDSGRALERQLFDKQRVAVVRAYREAGPAAVDGFRRVMRGLMEPGARAQLDRAGDGARRAEAGGTAGPGEAAAAGPAGAGRAGDGGTAAGRR